MFTLSLSTKKKQKNVYKDYQVNMIKSQPNNWQFVNAGRYYSGKVITPEFSPVTDFRESRCRQYDEGNCTRGVNLNTNQ